MKAMKLSRSAWFVSLFLAIAFAGSAHASESLSPDEILSNIDRMRFPKGGFEANIVITPYKDGQAQNSGNYVVRTNGSNQALVEATSTDQLGQKFLTTDNGIFFYAPRTKRAIRLTPLQTLRGQASIGDISRIHFANDYSAMIAHETLDDCKAPACIALELNSKNEASTYLRILLTVHKRDKSYEPIKALLYLASGKLIKIIEYSPSTSNLPPLARYLDTINQRLETRVEYKSIRHEKFPASMFNPRSLEQ
jgi:hypothetical protein